MKLVPQHVVYVYDLTPGMQLFSVDASGGLICTLVLAVVPLGTKTRLRFTDDRDPAIGHRAGVKEAVPASCIWFARVVQSSGLTVACFRELWHDLPFMFECECIG